MTALQVDGHADLSPRSEGEFRLEVERVGGYAVDPDTAVQATSAYNFLADCRAVVVAAEGVAL